MVYVPPNGNNANFALSAYTPISGNLSNFEMQPPLGYAFGYILE